MTLDEAIKHAEEVAAEKTMQSEFDTDYQCYQMSDAERNQCKKCAEEHKQLANWLKQLKRSVVLLKAAKQLLEKQNHSVYVLNLLCQTVFYDDAECDGNCLLEDIEYLLDEYEEQLK